MKHTTQATPHRTAFGAAKSKSQEHPGVKFYIIYFPSSNKYETGRIKPVHGICKGFYLNGKFSKNTD